MSLRTRFTTISPLPPNISRDIVLEFLHDHQEMIDLNPLVKERHPIAPPPHCPPDELSCVWYSLTDKISYLPGDLITGDVTYTCAFTDLKNGLQTHCYAPAGLRIRDRWTLNGSLPDEEPEPAEPGIGAPRTGLYIREDVDMKCNVILTTFVKRTLKKSHALLIDRLKAKAEILSQSVEEKVGGRAGENVLALSLVGTGQRMSKSSGGAGVVRNTGGLSPQVMQYYEQQVQTKPTLQQQGKWLASPQHRTLAAPAPTGGRYSPQPERRYQQDQGRPGSQTGQRQRDQVQPPRQETQTRYSPPAEPQPKYQAPPEQQLQEARYSSSGHQEYQRPPSQPALQPQPQAPRDRTPSRGRDDWAFPIPEPLKMPSRVAKWETGGEKPEQQQDVQEMEAPKFQGAIQTDSPIGATLRGPFVMGPP
ncbi:hypothetical protein OQA88_12775 [Cercophora sp. LCS_1]